MPKFIKTAEAASLIKSGATVAFDGFIGCATPEEILLRLEERFLKTGEPRDLNIIFSSGGDGKARGYNHFAHEGFVKKAYSTHFGLSPDLQKLIFEEKVEAYNIPLGPYVHLFRAMAGHKPGVITHVGLGTFADPRYGGGRENSISKDSINEIIEIDGREYIRYKPIPIDVAVIRGTSADKNGNISMDNEAARVLNMSIATAAKNAGGIVIVQVADIVENGALNAREIGVPGAVVDYVCKVDDMKNHMTTYNIDRDDTLTGKARAPEGAKGDPMPLDARKIIARRALMEMEPGDLVNLGIGMPEGISAVAAEMGRDDFIMTVEAGIFGGNPLPGQSFGASRNPEAIVDMPLMLDFYEGGGLDKAFLGMAEADENGNINVSKFGTRIVGFGGFVDISQNTKNMHFLGTFTAGGFTADIGGGKLTITNEGRSKKFVKSVEQITFSGDYARKSAQNVLYITERAVFRLLPEGLTLTEIAPGVDLERDILAQMEFTPIIADDLKLMDPSIFTE